MEDAKKIRVSVLLEGDVILDGLIKTRIEREYGREMSDFEAAECLLYAYLNPKVCSLNEEKIIGGWDNVCDFEGRLKDLSLEKN
ncbi:hypothetical protein [Bacillus cereus]|uniref:hypothetical protein n=1 Tax=Bacillus cereus TaxID=1396 RepID=UPI0013607834|nr:hypothetical protein [Bacillus cereus]KAB2482769.1 hypothetical protein F8159_05375 [Bacillus cereus]